MVMSSEWQWERRDWSQKKREPVIVVVLVLLTIISNAQLLFFFAHLTPHEPNRQCTWVLEIVERERRLLGEYTHEYGPADSARLLGTTISHSLQTSVMWTNMSLLTTGRRQTLNGTSTTFSNTVVLRDTLKESGDILIIDNAAVHGGYESQHALDNLLDEYDVELDFQPAAYSPELNLPPPPCELVFSVIKRHIRNIRQIYQKLMSETFHALSTITQEHDWLFYLHWIFPRNNILPDLPLNKNSVSTHFTFVCSLMSFIHLIKICLLTWGSKSCKKQRGVSQQYMAMQSHVQSCFGTLPLLSLTIFFHRIKTMA